MLSQRSCADIGEPIGPLHAVEESTTGEDKDGHDEVEDGDVEEDEEGGEAGMGRGMKTLRRKAMRTIQMREDGCVGRR